VIKRLLQEHVSKLRLSAVDATPWVMAVLLLALVPAQLIQAQTFNHTLQLHRRDEATHERSHFGIAKTFSHARIRHSNLGRKK